MLQAAPLTPLSQALPAVALIALKIFLPSIDPSQYYFSVCPECLAEAAKRSPSRGGVAAFTSTSFPDRLFISTPPAKTPSGLAFADAQQLSYIGHELQHLADYRRVGIARFAQEYNNYFAHPALPDGLVGPPEPYAYYRDNPYEKAAFAVQDKFYTFFANVNRIHLDGALPTLNEYERESQYRSPSQK